MTVMKKIAYSALIAVFAGFAYAALRYETVDRYFWKAEVPAIRRLRLTTNDFGTVVKPTSLTSVYVDIDTREAVTDESAIIIDLERHPDVTTMFLPSGMPIKVGTRSANQFIVSSGVTNVSVDRVVQIRNIGPTHYLITELRTQFPEESIFRVQTKENNNE